MLIRWRFDDNEDLKLILSPLRSFEKLILFHGFRSVHFFINNATVYVLNFLHHDNLKVEEYIFHLLVYEENIIQLELTYLFVTR